jgi:GAF domain-containing protein
MEPIPETVEAMAELAVASDDDLLAGLTERARLVRSLVPDCVGLSLASVEHGVTFTLVATSDEIAVLDAVQYAFGGPCVDAAHTDEVLEYQRDGASLGERDWQDFARATAASGIGSTLSLPILEGERVIGTVNLYAASPDAFTDRHNALAVILTRGHPAP